MWEEPLVDALSVPLKAPLLSMWSYHARRAASYIGTKEVSFSTLPKKIRNKVHENVSLKFRELKTTQTLKHSVWFESWTKVCYATSGVIPVEGL